MAGLMKKNGGSLYVKMSFILVSFFIVFSTITIIWAQGIRSALPPIVHGREDVKALIKEAEKAFYNVSNPTYLDEVDEILNQIEVVNPNTPYLYWARARVAFWKKEKFYLLETQQPEKDFRSDKLTLATACHTHADQCLKLDERNAECHLMKGVCYAMQASTWGQTFASLRVAKKMDRQWMQAAKLPSTFEHLNGIKTFHLATALRAILYRVMPDSFWFRLFAGVRGNKKKAFEWMKEAVIGPLKEDPVTLLELAVTSLCYGNEDGNKDTVKEGMNLLQSGLKLKDRNEMDRFDKTRIEYLLQNPDEACHYRRERFEKISDSNFQSAKDKDK